MVKIGLIGWGYWGRNYAKYFDTLIEAQLVWVCDSRSEMLRHAKRKYPHIHISTDFNDMISSGVDGVIIAVPAKHHFKIAQKVISNNIPVLLEKPMTSSLASSVKLMGILQEHKKSFVLMGHTFLYNRAVECIKEKISNPDFGKIQYLEFRRQSYGPIRDDVDVIWDFAEHDISMTTFFLKQYYPEKISAVAKRYSKNSQNDMAVITLEYPKNIMVNINVAWLYPIKVRQTVILGSKQMIVFDDTHQTEPLKLYDASLNYPDESSPFQASFLLGDIIVPRIDVTPPLQSLLSHFVDCIRKKARPKTPALHGLRISAILDTISYAAATGKKVDCKKHIKHKLGKLP